jgi:hypothetical protein
VWTGGDVEWSVFHCYSATPTRLLLLLRCLQHKACTAEPVWPYGLWATVDVHAETCEGAGFANTSASASDLLNE